MGIVFDWGYLNAGIVTESGGCGGYRREDVGVGIVANYYFVARLFRIGVLENKMIIKCNNK